jgi:hypothetical protein
MLSKFSYEDLLKLCSGVIVHQKVQTGTMRHGVDRKYIEIEPAPGPILPPDREFFIEIRSTATKGTIGRLVGIDPMIFDTKDYKKISTYSGSYVYEVDGRPSKGRIQIQNATILVNHTGKTKYIRAVKPPAEKPKIPAPVNKFKQELKVGDWIIGVQPGKVLGIGRVTRWTAHTIWATRCEDLKDKTSEIKFDTIKETFLLPNEDHLQLLTMATLKGWKGR